MQNQITTSRKIVRSDSWAASLTEQQQWELYFRSKTTDNWLEPLLWAQKEFGLAKLPSHSSFYRWRNQLWKCEQDQRLLDAAAAASNVKALAEASPDLETLSKMFTMLATKAALDGSNPKTALEWMKAAEILQKSYCANNKTKLLEHSVKIKEDFLDITKRRFEIWRKQNEEDDSESNRKLTDEEKIRVLDKLFGRHVDPDTPQAAPVPLNTPPIPPNPA